MEHYMLAGKYKLVISNNFNGCVVVCSDSLAGLKEAYYEVKLSQLDKLHEAKGMVSLDKYLYTSMADKVLRSADIIQVHTDEHSRWFGNHVFQIAFFNVAFRLIKDVYPVFFDKSFANQVRNGIITDVSRTTLRLIFEKMDDLGFNKEELPDPLVRIALFEFATLAGLPISDDSAVTKVKGKYFMLDHELKFVV